MKNSKIVQAFASTKSLVYASHTMCAMHSAMRRPSFLVKANAWLNRFSYPWKIALDQFVIYGAMVNYMTMELNNKYKTILLPLAQGFFRRFLPHAAATA